MTYQYPDVWPEKYEGQRPRRLLALTGGGIRGIITLEILKQLERQLADLTGEGAAFRLGRYFDYIGGTSTGAIIAAGLAIDMTTDELIDFYLKNANDMFEKKVFFSRARAAYSGDPLEKMLQNVLGDRTLGASDLKCLIMTVMRNHKTDSAWPMTNNPFAKYNDPDRYNCNLKIPLWQLVRASTAAPTYFPPEKIEVTKDQEFHFVDGGVTPYNDPGFLLFRHATGPQYGLNWLANEKDMLLISVGTGTYPQVRNYISDRGDLIFNVARKIPTSLMNGAAVDQDINCRHFGRCVYGAPIDREIGDLIPRKGDYLTGDMTPLDEDCNRSFLYVRYDPNLTKEGLEELSLSHIKPKNVQEMDAVKYVSEMQEIGKAYSQKALNNKFQKSGFAFKDYVEGFLSE